MRPGPASVDDALMVQRQKMALAACEWGLAGVAALRERVSALVIVDVLSFSTAVDMAVSRGGIVYPFPSGDQAAAEAEAARVGAMVARPRKAAGGQLSLSPVSIASIPKSLKLLLPSPNGSRLSLACGETPVFTGCLRNASAIAKALLSVSGGGDIGVVPAGERWPDNSLRPAVEDLLGAGAILHHLEIPCSPEAQVVRDAYRAVRQEVPNLVRDSISGRELIDGGYPDDVELAVALNASSQTPMLIEGAYRAP
jgi:2-phosphosulfolactate phosphatase